MSNWRKKDSKAFPIILKIYRIRLAALCREKTDRSC